MSYRLHSYNIQNLEKKKEIKKNRKQKNKKKHLNIPDNTGHYMIVLRCKHLRTLLTLSCGRNGQDTKKTMQYVWVTSRLTWALVRCWPAYFECFYQLKDNLTDWKIHQSNISYGGNNNHFQKKKKNKKKDIKPQQHLLKDVYRCMHILYNAKHEAEVHW